MDYKKQKFSYHKDREFLKTLNLRVDNYFNKKQISRNQNTNMVLKSVFAFSLYFIPYFVLLFAGIQDSLLALLLWTLMGLGMASIGLTVMHDAGHGAYAKQRWINQTLGHSLNIVGGTLKIWKLQHNVLHHSYTNIDGLDEDIDTPFFLRFSPHKKPHPIHRFQFLYFWFFYGLSTFFWVTTKEYAQAIKYRKMGVIKTKQRFYHLILNISFWKILYYAYILVLPSLILPFSIGFNILSFLVMHFVAGTILSFIFQTAHVMPKCEYPLPDKEGNMENSWVLHELMTTCNYAPKSRFFSWFVGALNYQIEHHLFPKICHVHYKPISKIVASTAKEYNLPYHTHSSFFGAVAAHVKMLYRLGK